MNRFVSRGAMVVAAMLSVTAFADGHDDNRGHPLTVAVFGDWPYSQNLLDNAHLLINSVDADRDVSLVIHVGDIHSGSMPCTSAGILPPIPTSKPGWNQEIFFEFQQFRDPLVYLPGDNEWSDCHKSKQFSQRRAAQGTRQRAPAVLLATRQDAGPASATRADAGTGF